MGSKKKKHEGSSLHLTDTIHPFVGIVAVFFGVVSVVIFTALCFVSSQSHGKAGMMIGFAGIICFLISLVGFGLSWYSLNQENIRPLFPTIAAVINGLSAVFYFLLYMLGMFGREL